MPASPFFHKVTRPSSESDGITKTQYPHPQNPSRDKTENDAQSRLKALAKTDNGDEINMCMTKRCPDSVLPLLTGYTIRQEKHVVALDKRSKTQQQKSKGPTVKNDEHPGLIDDVYMGVEGKAHLAFTRKTCHCFSGSACVNRPPCLCCYVCCLSACLPPKDLLPLDQAIITARHDITYALATTRTSREKKVIHHIFPEDDGGPPKPHADDKDRNKRKSYSKKQVSRKCPPPLIPL